MSENIMFVPSRLKSSVVGGYVTGTDQIVDDATGKSQAEINAGIGETVINTVNEAIRESTAINETVGNKINEKVPQVVAQALNDAVMPAVQEMISQEIYGGDKPEGASVVTSENILKKLGNAIDNSASVPEVENPLAEAVDSIINNEIYGTVEKPEGGYVITNQNFSSELSSTLDGAIGDSLDNKIGDALDEKLDNLKITDTKYKLTVNGTLNGDAEGVDLGSVITPATNGTAGQYLKSTGNGAPVWADIPTSEGGLSQMQVEQMINQEVYKQGTKPVNVDNVTSANILEEWEDAVSNYDQSHIGGGSILAPLINLELYGSSVKPAGVEMVTTENLKYGKVDYTISKVSSEGGAVTLDATVPVHEITASANISGITFANNTVPEDGHSCHVIVKAAEALSVSIADGATMATVGETSYLSVCPESSDITLNITAGGYVEFDLFRIGENIYIRGI